MEDAVSDDYEHADPARRAQADSEDLAAIRIRADRAWVSLHEIDQAKADCRALLSRLDAAESNCSERIALLESQDSVVYAAYLETIHDLNLNIADLKAERDAIARDAESTVTALNAAVQRLAEQRDSAYARLSSVCAYLERLPSRTPERERQITAIHMQLGPSRARVDGLP